MALKEFQVVDQKKFAALSNDAFLDLRAVGALDLAYFHFSSLGRLARLGQLLADRTKPPQRPPQPIPALAKGKPAGKPN